MHQGHAAIFAVTKQPVSQVVAEREDLPEPAKVVGNFTVAASGRGTVAGIDALYVGPSD